MKLNSFDIFPSISFPDEQLFSLSLFRQLDYLAVDKYQLSIELMMENAGWQLARLVLTLRPEPCTVFIGIGKGNNGGGGLVAARRLLARGYRVCLDLPDDALNDLPARQLERAIRFGAKTGFPQQPDILIDAWLGFSQRLPLSDNLMKKIKRCNPLDIPKISLDIPSGYSPDAHSTYFEANLICCLAAPKKILHPLLSHCRIFIADLGIPDAVYAEQFLNYRFPDGNSGLVEWINK